MGEAAALPDGTEVDFISGQTNNIGHPRFGVMGIGSVQEYQINGPTIYKELWTVATHGSSTVHGKPIYN